MCLRGTEENSLLIPLKYNYVFVTTYTTPDGPRGIWAHARVFFTIFFLFILFLSLFCGPYDDHVCVALLDKKKTAARAFSFVVWCMCVRAYARARISANPKKRRRIICKRFSVRTRVPLELISTTYENT